MASAGWLVLARLGAAGRLSRGAVLALTLLGIAARAAFALSPPAFSEDVFRYVFEGRVVWDLGLGFPFAHAPSEARDLGVRPALLDEAWLRINHPHISTIYPPLAQGTFALAGGLGELLGGGHLLILKLLLVCADLGVWALAARALVRAGRPAAGALFWGLSPLVIVEVAREGHADSLSALGLALAISGFLAARPRRGYLGLALAALAKLNGLVVLPAAWRSTTRGLLATLPLFALLGLPWLLAGPAAGTGLGAYATRWRAGDGAFTLLLFAAEALLGGDWRDLGAFTVTRHQLARALAALLFAAGSAALLWRKPAVVEVPIRAGQMLLLLLLLSPTLHPWYVLWAMPFAAALPTFRGRGAIVVLACLAPLLHHPGWLELEDGAWTDLGWVRAAVHVPVWVVFLGALARRPSIGYPRGAIEPHPASSGGADACPSKTASSSG